jgi:hypothetical protein
MVYLPLQHPHPGIMLVELDEWSILHRQPFSIGSMLGDVWRPLRTGDS